VKRSVDLQTFKGPVMIRLRITVGTNVYDYDGGWAGIPDEDMN
jgi:hypothetical protein